MELSEITEREKDFTALRTRQDEDRDRIFVTSYAPREYKSKGGKELPDTYGVAVPLAATHYSKFLAKLMARLRKFKIITEDTNLDVSKIVQFLEDAESAGDKLLEGKLEPASLLTHMAHICHRGWIASQELWRIEDGKLITDSRALDPHFLTWKTAGTKMKWVSYKMERHAEDIKELYGIEVKGKTGIVRDAWDDEKEFVFIDEVLAKTEKNSYGYPPFVIGFAPWGPILQDKDSLVHKGESIFYPHRDMYEEINFSASISKSMAREGLRPALQTEDDREAEDYPVSGDFVTGVKPITFIPRPDMTNAQRDFSGRISSIVQQNTFALTEWGTTTDPMSGTALEDLSRGGGEVMNSRIVALENFLSNCGRMRLDQYIQLDETLSLGRGGEYKKKDLEGEYWIETHLIDASIEGYRARGVTAASLKGMMPDKWLRSEIVMADDPDSVDDQMEMEEAERLMPETKLLEQILSFVDKQTPVDDIHARLLLKRFLDLLTQQMGAGVQPLQPEIKPKSKLAPQRSQPREVL